MKSYKLEDVIKGIYGDGTDKGLKEEYEDIKAQYETVKSQIEVHEKTIESETDKMNRAKQTMELYKGDKTSPIYVAAEAEYSSAKTEIKKAKTEIATIKRDPANKKLLPKLEKAQKKLDEMVELLAQDPTINQVLVEETKKAYNQKILAEAKKIDNAEAKNKGIVGELLGKDKTDRAISDSFKTLKKKNAPMKKRIGITPAQQTEFDDAVTDLMQKINSKYKARITKSDVLEILDASERGELTEEYVIQRLAKTADKAREKRAKLEEARDKKVAAIEGRKTSTLTAEAKAKITENEGKIATLDTEIAAKEGSAEYGEMDTLLKDLKNNGVIVPELVPDIEDSSSEIRKAYERFVIASENVRKAFAEAKRNPGPDQYAEIDRVTAEYKTCCDEMKALTGFGAAEWQSYLNREINDGKRSIEGKEDIYYHTENKQLHDLEDDRRIKKSPEAKAEYDKLVDQTKIIDKGQAYILGSGGLPGALTTSATLFDFASHGNYEQTMENLKDKGVPIKDLLAKRALVKLEGLRGRLAGIKNFFMSKFGKQQEVTHDELPDHLSATGSDALAEYKEKSEEDRRAYGDVQRMKAEKGKLERENSDIIASAPTADSQIEQTDLELHLSSDATRKSLGKIAEDIDEER